MLAVVYICCVINSHAHAAQGPHGAAQPPAPDRPPAPGLIAKAGPGAALGSWAEGSVGREAVEKVYERSGSLNGDAVVIFVRALAAVSQEELVPVRPGEAPRRALTRIWLFPYSCQVKDSSTERPHVLGQLQQLGKGLVAPEYLRSGVLHCHRLGKVCSRSARIFKLNSNGTTSRNSSPVKLQQRS